MHASHQAPLVGGRTTLLSAGPGAGKTRLMWDFLRGHDRPALYLSLSPEDRDADHLLDRLLAALPVEADRSILYAIPSGAWGGRLARAMTEASPDLAVLLDDLHAIEGSQAEAELLAFIRNLAPSRTLVLASRHRLPPLSRPGMEVIEADAPIWNEQPLPSHVLDLPSELAAEALALCLVPGQAPNAVCWELERRNIAWRASSEQMEIRPGWASALLAALSLPLRPEVWTRFEAILQDHHRRGARTRQQRPLCARIQAIPAEIRYDKPIFLLIEGQSLYDQGDFREARAHFERALDRCAEDSSLVLDLRINLAQIRYEINPESLGVEELSGWLPSATSYQQACLLNLIGLIHWKHAERERAVAVWQQVLEIPIFGDPAIAAEHAFAYKEIASILAHRRSQFEAISHAERRLRLVREHGLTYDLLSAHLSLLEARHANTRIPLDRLLDIPTAAFHGCGRLAFCQYLSTLAMRAGQLGAWEYAESVATILSQHASAASAAAFTALADLLLLMAKAHQGVPETESHYEYMRDRAPFPWSEMNRLVMHCIWCRYLWDHDRQSEARELLTDLMASVSLPGPRAVLQVFGQALEGRYLTGMTPEDLADLRSQLESDPVGEAVGGLCAERIPGLRAPWVHLRVFGPLSLRTSHGEVLTGGKPKPMVLLANLVRVPGGLPSAELAKRVFKREGALESLHSSAYGLRKLLQPSGLSSLLLSGGGGYRLDWSQIDFCDLNEFDLLLEKAAVLRDEGCPQAAAIHARIALSLARRPIFENLDESLGQTRIHYHHQVRLAEEIAHLSE